MYYLVMSMYKEPQPASGYVAYDVRGNPVPVPSNQVAPNIHWTVVGVFEADKAEDACQAAAKKNGSMGNYFAVEGFPWGIDLTETDAVEFGTGQPMSRLKQLENRSREMEKEADITD